MANTHPAIAKMLEHYAPLSSKEDNVDALREILQEIVLLGLYEGGFFKEAAFYGGTALRILHGLPRFSEDLDFSLLKENPSFDLRLYEKSVKETLASFGFDVSIEMKEKTADSAVQSAFLKGNTMEQLLSINATKNILQSIHKDQIIKIKFEVDTEPPLHFQTHSVLRLVPRPYSITAMTLPSLFAGKMHALLCRAWGMRPKGRDWYDLVWYIAHKTPLDLQHLQARLDQSCKWLEAQKQDLPDHLTKESLVELLYKRIEQLDIAKAKNDVRPFIKEIAELELWSEAFFKQIVHDIVRL